MLQIRRANPHECSFRRAGSGCLGLQGSGIDEVDGLVLDDGWHDGEICRRHGQKELRAAVSIATEDRTTDPGGVVDGVVVVVMEKVRFGGVWSLEAPASGHGENLSCRVHPELDSVSVLGREALMLLQITFTIRPRQMAVNPVFL